MHEFKYTMVSKLSVKENWHPEPPFKVILLSPKTRISVWERRHHHEFILTSLNAYNLGCVKFQVGKQFVTPFFSILGY